MANPTNPNDSDTPPVPTRAEDHQLKLNAIRSALTEAGLKGVLFQTTHGFSWATSGGRNWVPLATTVGVAFLWVGLDNVAVITSNIEGTRIMREEMNGLSNVELVEFNWYDPKSNAEIIADKKWAEPGAWETDEGPVMGPKLDSMRIKLGLTPREVALYTALGKDCGVAIGKAAKECKVGETEYSIGGRLIAQCAALNIDTVACMVAADDRMDTCRHPLPTSKQVASRVMLVLCGRRDGLIASVTRCVHFGEPSEDLKKRHLAVAHVDAAAISCTYSGGNCGEVFKAMKDEYEKQGYPDEWKLHHQGGMAGYKSREFKAMEGSEQTIQINQAYAWNPSIAGTKSEDTVIVGQSMEPVIITETPGWPKLNCNVGGTVVTTSDGTKMHMGGIVVQRPDILVLPA